MTRKKEFCGFARVEFASLLESLERTPKRRSWVWLTAGITPEEVDHEASEALRMRRNADSFFQLERWRVVYYGYSGIKQRHGTHFSFVIYPKDCAEQWHQNLNVKSECLPGDENPPVSFEYLQSLIGCNQNMYC